MTMKQMTLDHFKECVMLAIPNKADKEIVGAVLAVAYEDGSIEERAFLTEGDISWQLEMVSKLIKSCTYSLSSCLACVPTGLKKVAEEVTK